MNALYVKSILYAYPNLDKITEQIDSMVERKAIASMDDYSPCEEQCEAILRLTEEKDYLNKLKFICRNIFRRLPRAELICLDYKYFKQKPKDFYKDKRMSGRSYYRRQERIIEYLSERFDKWGISDEWFERNLLCNDFIKELYRRLKDKEETAENRNPTLRVPKPYVVIDKRVNRVEKRKSA